MFYKTIGIRRVILVFCMLAILSFSGRKYVDGAVGRIVQVASPYSYTEMQKDIGELLTKYPQLQGDIIGQTKEGRYIYSLHLGKGKRSIQLNGAHHGREWITSLLLMQMAENYAEAYYSDKKYSGYNVKSLLDKVSITIIPMVNPDGVQIAQFGPTSKQKGFFAKIWGRQPLPWNRWKANGAGVDPNCNYNALWKYKNTKLKPYAWGYKGKKPETAEEVVGMVKDTRQKEYAMVISYHTAGRIIYWNYFQKGTNLKRDYSLAKEIGKITGYTLVKPTTKKSIYAGYKDWFIQTFKKPGFTIEVGKANNGNSVPVKEYPTIFNKNHVMGLWAANNSLKLKLPSKVFRVKNILKVNGTELKTQTPPFYSNNKVYISVQDIALVLSGSYSTDVITKEAVINTDDFIIKIYPKIAKIEVNGQVYAYGSKTLYNTIMVDPSFLKEVLGLSEIQWDKGQGILNITNNPVIKQSSS